MQSATIKFVVAPHVGAWIETCVRELKGKSGFEVAPHVGAWIETKIRCITLSLPLVAPHVGAWIETESQSGNEAKPRSRAPCGRVD